ncbi:MAG: hypothetical protein LUO98_07215 [Methanoregula sp.]|nr:hypothetical protein [Methanoregula sp.]
MTGTTLLCRYTMMESPRSRINLGFSCRQVPEVPSEENDTRTGFNITDEGGTGWACDGVGCG